MPIYVLQIRSANHWGRPTKVVFVGPFLNMQSGGTIAESRDNKLAEAHARRWMSHPYHAETGVLRSTVVEMDEPVVGVQEPRAIW